MEGDRHRNNIESFPQYRKLPNQRKDEKQVFELFLFNEEVTAITDIQVGKDRDLIKSLEYINKLECIQL